MFVKKVDINDILLFTAVCIIFSIGMIFNFSWKIGWVIAFIAIVFLLLFYAFELANKKIIYDKFLFLFGVLIFILLEPTVFLFQGLNFPFINGLEISSNYIANKTGVIISLYIVFFYIGRVIALNVIKPKTIVTNNRTDQMSSLLLGLFILMAVSPFFLSGGNDLFANFLINN